MTPEKVDEYYRRIFEVETLPYGAEVEVNAFINDVLKAGEPELRTLIQTKIVPILRSEAPRELKRDILSDFGKIVKHSHLRQLFFNHIERAVTSDYFNAFKDAVNGKEPGKRTVVFVAHSPYFLILRESMYLRKNGFRTYLISTWEFVDELLDVFRNNFDGVITTHGSLNITQRLITRLKPDIFHVQCCMWFTALGRIAIENRGSAKVTCEFYDITSIYADRRELLTNWEKETIDFEMAMENYIVKNSDGIITRFPEWAIDELRERNNSTVPHVRMQAYPCEEFISYSDRKLSEGEKSIRTVFAGGLVPTNERHPANLFPESGTPLAYRTILEQDIGIDVFQILHSEIKEGEHGYNDYIRLAEEFPNFRLLTGVSPDKLAESLSVYNFGILLFDYNMETSRISETQRRSVVATKIFSYLEAGIPVLVNAEYEEMAHIVSNHGLGLALHSSEITVLREKIESCDYSALVESVKRFNQEQSMEKMISRLIALYDNLSSPSG